MVIKRSVKKLSKWPAGKNGQDIQDNLFKKMSVEKKIHLTFELTKLCLKLNSFHGNNRS